MCYFIVIIKLFSDVLFLALNLICNLLINLPHAETWGDAQSEKSAKPNHITYASVKAILSRPFFVPIQNQSQSLELLNLNL